MIIMIILIITITAPVKSSLLQQQQQQTAKETTWLSTSHIGASVEITHSLGKEKLATAEKRTKSSQFFLKIFHRAFSASYEKEESQSQTR